MDAGLLKEWLDIAGKLLDGQGADVLAIEVHCLGVKRVFFGEIHDSVGAVDVFEREGGGEFFEGKELAVVFGRPAEEAEEVDEGVGKESGIAISGDADDGAVFAFGELGAVGGNQQRKMGELRRGGTDAFKDEDVLEGVGEVVLAANDVGDAQVGVVDAGREVIGRVAVAAQEGEVFDLVGWLGLGP